MNTPQFDWCRTHLPRQPQPVPPIYEPEVAARAIFEASDGRRREVFVGAPTVVAVEGTKFAPGVADRYLADKGFDSQMTSEPSAPNRADNLFLPVPGDYAARGRFSMNGNSISETAWTSAFPSRALLAGAMGLGVAAYLATRLLPKRRRRQLA
jgi:hypothetical protein